MLEAGLGAEVAAPAAVWLCHPACKSHGEIIEAYAGRFSRAVIGELPGFWDFQATPESVAQGFESLAADVPLWQSKDAASMAFRVLSEAPAHKA